MNKLKFLSIAFILAVALTNLKISKDHNNNVSFNLSQLVANAQSTAEVAAKIRKKLQ